MKHFKRKFYIAVIIVVLVIAVIAAVSIYRANKIALLDRTAYRTLSDNLSEACESGVFASQQDLRDYISSWAESEGLEFKVDKYGNIIFERDATSRKSKVSPTVVCVSYNYETVSDNIGLLVSAAMIADTDLVSGRRVVIFFNDEQNTGYGYRNINKKFFSNKSKVIYMDYGNSSYISRSSFAQTLSTLSIPSSDTQVRCDTAVRIHIEGIRSCEVEAGISKQPNPVSAFSNLLTRLKSKSTTCQLADFSVVSNGNMSPVSLDATILMNSYSAGSFTDYLDKQIKSWKKKYKESNVDLAYYYEVIDDPEKLPEKAFSNDTLKKLTNVLYMVKNGVYQYEAGDAIPDGREEGDVCGINCITGLRMDDNGSICIDILSQGYDKSYIDRINGDTREAALLFDCSFKTRSYTPAFLNDQDSLSLVMMSTYLKVNDVSGTGIALKTDADNYFTPCSYIYEINDVPDIVHLRLNDDKAEILTNTLLCYIETKGNFLSL